MLLLTRGAPAVYTAVRAVATARLIARGGRSAGHDIAMQPVLQPAPKTKQEAHGIRMYLYRVPLQLTTHSGQEYRSAGDDNGDSSMVGPASHVERVECRTPQVRVSASTKPEGLAGSLATVLQGPKGGMGCIIESAGAFAVYRYIQEVHVWKLAGIGVRMDSYRTAVLDCILNT